jgi:hypothetical protein
MSTYNVLAYNSINNQNIALRRSANALDSSIATLNSQCFTAISNISTFGTQIIGNAGPNQAHIWCNIPEGSGWTAGFKICNTAAQFNCGRCCRWTVPAGVTCARFQIWGAGAGAGSIRCCGGAPFGGTGAYASVIIPVTAGRCYTLCAGCAFCCFSSPCAGGTMNVQSCPSFVTGCCLTGFCAQGGIASLFCHAKARDYCGVNQCNWCMFNGLCICLTGTSYCFGCSAYTGRGARDFYFCNCAQCNCVIPSNCGAVFFPPIAACNTGAGTAVNGTVYGIRGAFPGFQFDQNNYGYFIHPPIYGFPCACLCMEFNNGTTCGGCDCKAASGYLQYPGAGGMGSIVFGGCNNRCGDMGRMGMVCVSYK